MGITYTNSRIKRCEFKREDISVNGTLGYYEFDIEHYGYKLHIQNSNKVNNKQRIS